jgi:hypothetical protein
MDPTALASATTAALAPYLIQAGETLASQALKKLPEQTQKLWGTIIEKFDGRPAAEGAAQELVVNAEDPDNQEAFNLQLKKMLRDDPTFAEEVVSLLKAEQYNAAVQNMGSGAAASGGSVAAGAGGIAIGGNVGGSVVFGNNNTLQGEDKSKN